MTTSPELPSAEEVEKLREIEELRQERLRFVALGDMDQAARVTETLTANARHLMVPSRWIVAYADRVAELERENERLREIGTLLIRKLYFNDHRHEDANTGQRLRALNYQSLAPPTGAEGEGSVSAIVRMIPAAYQAHCSNCGWHTQELDDELQARYFAWQHDRDCPRPNFRFGALTSCGCWYLAMPGDAVGKSVRCPIHSTTQIVKTNVPESVRDGQGLWRAASTEQGERA